MILLRFGADVNGADHEGQTALHWGANAGNVNIVEELLNVGAAVHASTVYGRQLIHYAAGLRFNGALVTQKLLDWGANPNALNILSLPPLFYAVQYGMKETIEILILNGADVNAIDQFGRTVIQRGLAQTFRDDGISEKLKILLQAGSKMDFVDDFGLHAIHYITFVGTIDVWDMIIKLADQDDLGFLDEKALHWGHSIQDCFGHCRNFNFRGAREDEHIERPIFDRMIEAIFHPQ